MKLRFQVGRLAPAPWQQLCIEKGNSEAWQIPKPHPFFFFFFQVFSNCSFSYERVSSRALRHAFSKLHTRESFLQVCRERSDWKLYARAHEDLKRAEHISLYIDPMILNTRHRGRQVILVSFEHKVVFSVCPVCRPHAHRRPAPLCLYLCLYRSPRQA